MKISSPSYLLPVADSRGWQTSGEKTREQRSGAGVVYTKPWLVELMLDMAGYLPEKRLAEMVALEPSAGDGAFLRAMVRRLVESCRLHGTPLEQATAALQAYEIDPLAAEKAAEVVRELSYIARNQPRYENAFHIGCKSSES